MTRYEPVFNESAIRGFLGASTEDRRRLLLFIEGLANEPVREGDYVEVSSQDRRIDVFLCDKWLVSAWVDHAVKEVRIVNVERV